MVKIFNCLLLTILVITEGYAADWSEHQLAKESEETMFIEQFFNYINGVQKIHAYQIITMCTKFLNYILTSAHEEESNMPIYETVTEKLQFLEGVLERNDPAELQQNIGETLEEIIRFNIDETEWRQFFQSCRTTNVDYFEKVRRAGRILREKFTEDGVRRFDEFFTVLGEIGYYSDDEIVTEKLFQKLDEQRANTCNCGISIFSDFDVYYLDQQNEY